MIKLFKKVKEAVSKFKEWSQGKYEIYENDYFILFPGDNKRPFLVNCVQGIGKFCQKNWKWILPLGILIVAILNLLKK